VGSALCIDLNQLILGRELSLPIHGPNGVLLVGAGTKITAELKQRLLARGMSRVLIDECDAAHVTLNEIHDERVLEAFEKKLSERLDSLIRTGMMSVRNSGPAVRDKVVRHGCQRYDAHSQAEITAENEKHAAVVSEVLESVVSGGEVDTERVDDVTGSCIRSLVADVEGVLSAGLAKKDRVTLAQHSMKIATLAMAIAIEMGLDTDNVRLVGLSGLLGDLGMAQVPQHLRDANRPLTEVEFVEIQKHPIRTANLLEKMHGLPSIVQIIAYQTHERPDGSGYPRGRTRQSIHPFALLMHVADAYAAMTSPRPYRPALMPYAAMTTLLEEVRRGRVDAAAVRSLLHVMSLFPIASFVTLSDGTVAQVLRANGPDFTRPIVQRVQAADGSFVDSADDSTLIDLSRSELQIIQALPTPRRHEIDLADRADLTGADGVFSHAGPTAAAADTSGAH
jgi:HD-GYP domain-containing protein (c-di-GMP phosphodiesterase class II)